MKGLDYHLLTFVTVAEKKNFTRAAEELHITQSAVTLSIKALEKKYEVKFFDRTNKYVRLTRAGEILYYHAKRILKEYEQVDSLIHDMTKVVSGPLLIGSSYTFGEYLLPRFISDFMKVHQLIEPKVTIQNSSKIINQVLEGSLDIGIIDGEIKSHPQLHITPFEQDELVIIVSADHPLASFRTIDLDSLYGETWILREEGSGTREVIDKLFKVHAFSPLILRSFGSTQIIKESVEAGIGISIVSNYSIQKELHMKTIHPIRLKNKQINRHFSYVLSKTDIHPLSVELFTQFLQTKNVLTLEAISYK